MQSSPFLQNLIVKGYKHNISEVCRLRTTVTFPAVIATFKISTINFYSRICRMKNIDDNGGNGTLSDDADENLRIENELLYIK